MKNANSPEKSSRGGRDRGVPDPIERSLGSAGDEEVFQSRYSRLGAKELNHISKLMPEEPGLDSELGECPTYFALDRFAMLLLVVPPAIVGCEIAEDPDAMPFG